MIDYREQYERRVLATKNGIVRLKEKLESQEEQLKNEQNIKRKEALERSIARTKKTIEFYKSQLKIMRLPTQEDMEYRMDIFHDFPKEVRAVLSNDVPVCFHGTRFGNIESILKSGGLSSSVDRLGYSTSYDVEDQVSVTVVNTLETTINGYTGLTSFEEPAGCVFLILPKDEQEYNSSRNSMLIGNVDFKQEPERLLGILTTPENVEQIRTWCQEYGVECDPKKICDFKEFLERVRAKNNINNFEQE